MNIKELRNKTKMSQSEFAKYFNIPVRTLQDWEQGRRDPAEYLIELIQYKIEGESEMIKIPSSTGEWNIIIDEVEYNFYYKDLEALNGLFLSGYDSQEEVYNIEGKYISATKEKYLHNKQGYRYVLEVI